MNKSNNLNPHILEEDLVFLSKYSNTIWKELNNKKIFITGGSGFFGRNFISALYYIEKLFDYNFSVTCITRDKKKFLEKLNFYPTKNNYAIIEGNLNKLNIIKNKYDILIHLADHVSQDLHHSNNDLLLKNSKENILNIIKFIKNCSIKNFIYLSSGAVYEKNIYGKKFLENTKLITNINDEYYYYAKRKIQSEEIIKNELSNHDVNYYIFRGFTFAGPYLELNRRYAITEFFKNCLNEKDIYIQNNILSKRSYLYSYEMVIWCLQLIFKNSQSGCFNLGSSIEITLDNLAYSIKSITNSKINIITNNKSNVSSYYVPDNSLYLNHSGLSQTILFEDILYRYYKWIRKSILNK